MASNDKPRTGLSLYANLLNQDGSNSSSATISSAPVTYKRPEDTQRDEDAAKRNAALRFQPTKRPQATQNAKSKTSVPKSQSSIPDTSSPTPEATSKAAAPPPPPSAAPPQPKTTLADWTADDDDINGFYAGEKRQRGGRKKRKKNKEEAVVIPDWDDVYDPSRPNNYEDYKHSEERYREIREWKDKLYRHRIKRRGSSEMSEDDERPNMNKAFAPPGSYSFAPPPTFEGTCSPTKTSSEAPPPPDNEDHYAAPPPPPTTSISNDTSGEDAYTRRMRLSGMAAPVSSTPPPPPPSSDSAPPPPPTQESTNPPPTISAAPVRYTLPSAPADLPKTDEELEAALADADAQEEAEGIPPPPPDEEAEAAPRSNRPGQKGFAARLMSKYGWSKGKGLGAEGTGIVNPLKVQVEKRKKRSENEGGGWIGPSAKGKIVGGKVGKGKEGAAGEKEDAGTGLSEVIVLKGMVDGMDLEREMGGGHLVQEIGEECGEKYGRVERVFVDRNSTAASIPVFIKFTSQLSGLRAVQALDGRIFNGNTISASYFDAEKFEQGMYE